MSMATINRDGAAVLVCGWFAMCANETLECLPLLDTFVPCCRRCAEKVDMVDKLIPVEVTYE